jgi:hypothetical protein
VYHTLKFYILNLAWPIFKILKISSFFLRFVTKEGNYMLMEEVTKKDLNIVMSSFKRDKIPRSNGWPMEFDIQFYELLEDDLVRMIEEVRSSSKVLGAFNATFLTLIPKRDNQRVPKNLSRYLCVICIYKILTKIMVMRITKILSKGLLKEQFGFLERKQLHDEIGSLQEGIHTMKQKN